MKITEAFSLPQGQRICTGCQSQHPTLFSMANISTTLQGILCTAGITTQRGPERVDSKPVHACWHWIWEKVLHLCAFKVLLQVKPPLVSRPTCDPAKGPLMHLTIFLPT